MAGKVQDRTGESVGNSGQAAVGVAIALAGALESLQSFSAGFDLAGAAETDIPVVLSSGQAWQTGKATFDDAANTLTFTTIERSSNADNPIDFDTASEVRCTPTAENYNSIVGAAPTNLGNVPAADSVQITSSTGSPTTVGAATGALAGVMSAAQFNQLGAVESELSTHKANGDTDILHVTKDQQDALNGANAPSASNVFATMADTGGPGGGEANTASNVGTGAGVFLQKVALDLQFKSLLSSNGGLTVVGGANEITFTPVYGTGANTICQGNDTRLNEPKTPLPHAASHASGQSDELTPADIGALSALQDDTTPVLGGKLSTNGNDIAIQDATPTPVGFLGIPPATQEVALAHTTSTGNYDENAGAIILGAGKAHLRGSSAIIEGLKSANTREVRVTDAGVLFGVLPPDPGWSETANSTFNADFGNGKTVGAWVQVTGLTVNPAADVTDGDRIDAWTRLHVENTEDKGGTLDIGIGINGATPTVVGASVTVSPETIADIVAAFTAVGHGGLTTADTVAIWARRGVSQDDAHLYLRGTTRQHLYELSVPGEGGGGAGDLTDATFPTHAKFAGQGSTNNPSGTVTIDFTGSQQHVLTGTGTITLDLRPAQSTYPGIAVFRLLVESGVTVSAVNSDATVIEYGAQFYPFTPGSRHWITIFFDGSIAHWAGMPAI